MCWFLFSTGLYRVCLIDIGAETKCQLSTEISNLPVGQWSLYYSKQLHQYGRDIDDYNSLANYTLLAATSVKIKLVSNIYFMAEFAIRGYNANIHHIFIRNLPSWSSLWRCEYRCSFWSTYGWVCGFLPILADYKAGFGDPSGEFWLGLDQLHTLTTNGNYGRRVTYRADNGDVFCASYPHISVNDESDNYRLTVSGYQAGSSNAGDSLIEGNPAVSYANRYHNGMSSLLGTGIMTRVLFTVRTASQQQGG